MFMANWATLDVEQKQSIWFFLKTVLKRTRIDYPDPREEELNKIQVPLILKQVVAEFELDGKDIGIYFTEFKARFEELIDNARKRIYIEMF